MEKPVLLIVASRWDANSERTVVYRCFIPKGCNTELKF
jgi:hypothetical protein